MNPRLLPYMGYTGMYGPKGDGFSAVLVINRVSILDILVINRVSILAILIITGVRFLHHSLQLGVR